MEHSTAENAKSEGLTKLHEMVMNVKSDREVGLAYMKAFEAEKRILEKEKAEFPCKAAGVWERTGEKWQGGREL